MNYLLKKDLSDFKKYYKYINLLLIGYLLNALIFHATFVEYNILYEELFLGIGDSILTIIAHILEIFTLSFITLSIYYKSIGSSLSNLFLRISKNDWFKGKIISFIIIAMFVIMIKSMLLIVVFYIKKFEFNEILFLFILKNWLYILLFIGLTICFANTVKSRKTVIYSIITFICYILLIFNKNINLIYLLIGNIMMILINIGIFIKYREEIFDRLEE